MRKKLFGIIFILGMVLLSGCTKNTVGGSANPNAVIRVTAPKSVATQLNTSINATIIFSAPSSAFFTGLNITNGLTNLPAGWSSRVSRFSCPIVLNNNACSLTLTFSPTNNNQRGTLTLNFSYFSVFGAQKTGTVRIPYFVSSSTYHKPNTQFGVLNNCPYTVWFQYTANPNNLPDPTIVALNQGESYDYQINGQFVNSFRVWPKTGCNESGNNCTVGQSSNPCPSGGCAPAVDSKFEGTFNAPGNNNVTSYDGSLVDGFTLPFSIRVTKATNENNPSCLDVEASSIDYNTGCPSTENEVRLRAK